MFLNPVLGAPLQEGSKNVYCMGFPEDTAETLLYTFILLKLWGPSHTNMQIKSLYICTS